MPCTFELRALLKQKWPALKCTVQHTKPTEQKNESSGKKCQSKRAINASYIIYVMQPGENKGLCNFWGYHALKNWQNKWYDMAFVRADASEPFDFMQLVHEPVIFHT